MSMKSFVGRKVWEIWIFVDILWEEDVELIEEDVELIFLCEDMLCEDVELLENRLCEEDVELDKILLL